MNATVCFFLAATLQCHDLGFVRYWPIEGTGARVCAETADGFRCQNISRQDGFELVRQYQCVRAQRNESDLPQNMKYRSVQERSKIRDAKESLRDAEKTVQEWKKHPPHDYWDERLRNTQLRKISEARDAVARAIKQAEDVHLADIQALEDAKARVAKWCGSQDARANESPTDKPIKSAPIADRNPHDFPLASCKLWDGTVTERSGIDSESASMHGIVTRANVEEYCNRIVQDDTPARGAAVAECLQRTLPIATKAELSARANCMKATLEFSDGTETKRVRFPIADTGCASGLPPLIAQFRKLCPRKASELILE